MEVSGKQEFQPLERMPCTLFSTHMMHMLNMMLRRRPWSGMGSVAAAAAAAAAAAPEVEAPPELQPLLATHSSQADDAGLLHKRGAPSRGGHGAGSPGNLGAGAGEGEDVSMCGASGTCGALAFIAQRQNWDVAILIWIKATGAMVWGAADILNGRYVHGHARARGAQRCRWGW